MQRKLSEDIHISSTASTLTMDEKKLSMEEKKFSIEEKKMSMEEKKEKTKLCK